MNGILVAFFLWGFFWMPISIGFLIGVIDFFNIKGNSAIDSIGVIFIILFPIIASFKTAEVLERHNSGTATVSDKKNIKTVKRFALSWVFCLVGINLITSFIGKQPSLNEQASLYFGLPTLMSIFISILIPLLNEIFVDFFGSNNPKPKKSLSSNTNSFSFKIWFLNKIIAPIITAIVLGVVTYFITGHYETGGGLALISVTVSFLTSES
ncbi:MAG: hypothetical protein EPGJADBJ_00014 [Saprospiraceae bacterium]|nr:hypothetical protein [Saprospiraceae bacterium]